MQRSSVRIAGVRSQAELIRHLRAAATRALTVTLSEAERWHRLEAASDAQTIDFRAYRATDGDRRAWLAEQVRRYEAWLREMAEIFGLDPDEAERRFGAARRLVAGPPELMT